MARNTENFFAFLSLW